MEHRSRNRKDRPRLLARRRVRRRRSSWHAVDREFGGSPATQTPFRRKTYASGTYPGRYTFFVNNPVNAAVAAAAAAAAILSHSGYHSIKSFDQTFHLEKRWKLVREMGSGAYGVVMSVRHPLHYFHFFFSFAICFRSP